MALIGIDIRKLDDYGIGTYIRNLIFQLDKSDSGREFLLYRKPGTDPGVLPQGMKNTVEKAGLYSLLEPFRLGRSARRARIDLLHCPHYVTPFAPGCPMAVTVHDLIHLLFPEYLPNRGALRYARFFLKRAAKRASVIFAVSERTKQDILHHLPAREDQVVVTHNAVDPQMTRSPEPDGLEDTRSRYILNHPYVLYVGNLKPHKNLVGAVEAFASFRRRAGSEWRFVFVGSQTAGNEVHRAIERAGLKGAVRFLGFVPDKHLLPIYYLAGLFLFPSLYEGFGLPPLEAMAAGTPVVSSNSSSLPEVLGDAALLVDPHDPEAMASAMLRIISDDELRWQLIERGRKQVEKFSWRETARKTLEGYTRALGRAGSDR
jgi:glycosyltransferase involved in cell wall biosynthesis